MNKFLSAVLAATIASASCMAQAATGYAFSYTFESGASVTGSFTGDASGNLINNLADIHFSFNGTPVAGPIIGQYGPFNPNPPIASFDGRQNQLLFANSDFSRIFMSLDAGSDYGPPGTNAFLVLIDGGLDGACDSVTGQAAAPYTCGGMIGRVPRWSVSVVPEPNAALLLAAGLGLLAWRRRSART